MSTTWPKGVIARYATRGGATVSVWEVAGVLPCMATCTGCRAATTDGGPDSSQPYRWAQKHAKSCRALPSPPA